MPVLVPLPLAGAYDYAPGGYEHEHEHQDKDTDGRESDPRAGGGTAPMSDWGSDWGADREADWGADRGADRGAEAPRPARDPLPPGTYVIVPLGRRHVVGVVWDPDSPLRQPGVAAERLKPIAHRLEVPPLSAVMRQFIERVARYTVTPAGAVLRMALSQAAVERPTPLIGYTRADTPWPQGLKETAARRRVLEAVQQAGPLTAADLAREAGVGSGVVRGLADRGILEPRPLPREGERRPAPDHAPPRLAPDQAAAADRLRARIGAGYSTTLLDGVTGAGKTEVYFEALAECLHQGWQALVLLPEIALSAQWLARFEARFGVAPAQWHSERTAAQRRHTWRAVVEGRARVVVGARSALFLPYPALGLIIVDEEHESAYKQEDGVLYHARDMAVLRAHLGGIASVLVSATPALETLINAAAGRYDHVVLPRRHAAARLPEITRIDLRAERPPARRWIAPPLRAALGSTLEAGEQALLFLNRRGYAPLTLCRTCGHRLACPHCTAWLVEHRLAGRLQCHHCGHSQARPPQCPSCAAADSLAAVGPGVERLAEEVAEILPAARVGHATSDTLRGPGDMAAFAEAVARGEIDIIIGTQIVAKGHHFPALTLVGVIDADLGLGGGDLRAAERTYQMLHQVAGRAGRADRPGRVLLQTLNPGDPVMHALAEGDRDSFMAVEARQRQAAGLPPFGRLVAVIISAPDGERADQVAGSLADAAPRAAPASSGIEVLGPAPAPLTQLRGRHRRRFLVKAPRSARIQAVVQDWLGRVSWPASVRVTVDVDPYSFL